MAALACGEGGGGASPTPESTITQEPTPLPAPTPTASAEPQAFSFVYREFGQTADTIWRVDPADAGRQEKLATIGHAVGLETFISLSPQGDTIAYTALPEGARDERTGAQAWVLNLDGGRPRLLAQGVNLLTRPLWSPDGRFVYVRRNLSGSIAILQIDLGNGQESAVLQHPVAEANELIPIAFAPDGVTLYYVQIGGGAQTGVFLGAVDVASREGGVLMRLSDQAARDFALSPDGRRLAFINQALLRAFVADIQAGTVAPLSASGLGSEAQLGPVWHPSGDMVSVGQLSVSGQPSPEENSGAMANIPLTGGQPSFLAPPDKGFDVPLSWAPGGSFLAARSFQGNSLSNPGSSRLVLVSLDGQRVPVAEGSGAEPVGWVS
jgi:Tol biopolymer transport system component